MHAITLAQPWASLVVAGRIRAIPFPYSCDPPLPREIAVIAARSFSSRAIQASLTPIVLNAFAEAGYSDAAAIPRGALVGLIEIASDTRITSALVEMPETDEYAVETEAGHALITSAEALFGEWRAGWYAWNVSAHFMLSEPIPCQGARGLRELPVDVDELVRARATRVVA